jgi:hypothetical protein
MGLLLGEVFAGTNKKLITNPANVGTEEQYDIIIVGGGKSKRSRAGVG